MGWDPISNTMTASEEAWVAAFAVSPLTYIKPITYYCKSQKSAPYILYTLAKWMTQDCLKIVHRASSSKGVSST